MYYIILHNIILSILKIYIYIYAHSIYCSEGVADLILYEDKWWANVPVGAKMV